MKITVVVTGRSYHTAAGLPEALDLPEGSGLDHALQVLASQLGEDAALPPTCLVAVSGRHVGTLAKYEPAELRDGDELTLIAPVAGG